MLNDALAEWNIREKSGGRSRPFDTFSTWTVSDKKAEKSPPKNTEGDKQKWSQGQDGRYLHERPIDCIF